MSGARGLSPPRATAGNVRAVLDRLGGKEQEILEDAELNAALAPFRERPPLPLVCPKRGCSRRIVWCALHSAVPRVMFDSAGPRRGWLKRKHRQEGVPSWLGPQPPAPYDYWSLGPSDGIDSAIISDPRGYEGAMLRWTFVCRGCNATYTLKNSALIKRLVVAIAGNEKEIKP